MQIHFRSRIDRPEEDFIWWKWAQNKGVGLEQCPQWQQLFYLIWDSFFQKLKNNWDKCFQRSRERTMLGTPGAQWWVSRSVSVTTERTCGPRGLKQSDENNLAAFLSNFCGFHWSSSSSVVTNSKSTTDLAKQMIFLKKNYLWVVKPYFGWLWQEKIIMETCPQLLFLTSSAIPATTYIWSFKVTHCPGGCYD